MNVQFLLKFTNEIREVALISLDQKEACEKHMMEGPRVTVRAKIPPFPVLFYSKTAHERISVSHHSIRIENFDRSPPRYPQIFTDIRKVFASSVSLIRR